MLRSIALFVILLFTSGLSAQYLDHIKDNQSGSFFGFRGGPSIGTQSWSGFQTAPLLAYHGDFFIESLPENGQFSLWASLGYHLRGSRIQWRNAVGINNNVFRIPGESFQFRNASLAVGGKQVFKYTKIADVFYTIGLRLDYTLGTNLGAFNDPTGAQPFLNFYPIDSYAFINRVNYGLVVGGGFDIPLSDKVGATLQITANPDFSLQYNQPPIDNVINPFQAANTSLPERRIRNFTLEVSAGFRFLRKVEYID